MSHSPSEAHSAPQVPRQSAQAQAITAATFGFARQFGVSALSRHCWQTASPRQRVAAALQVVSAQD